MWAKFLSGAFERIIKQGGLTVVYPDGRKAHYGESSSSIAIHLHSPLLFPKLVLDPNLVLGEAYMDGTLTIENDDIYGLLELLISNLTSGSEKNPFRWLERLRLMSRSLAQFNPAGRAQRNVAHHYDLSGELYDLFLDADRQYSCAYFQNPEDSLETAQKNKKTLISRKLLLKSDQRVLDIGCGWGGLALHLAREHGAQVTGVTLSKEQHGIATTRALSADLADRTEFRLLDYRQIEGTFDRIVSVGMFEHVGIPHYSEFFETLRDRLTDGGVALLHTIGRTDGPGATSPWIAKYIFPGGYIPALSEILPHVERSGLFVTDIEVLRLHYAETLKAWRSRFEANSEKVRKIYDERFCRMWRFYLVASELAFRECGHVVFQIQLAKKQQAVPLTRDYLVATASQDLLKADAA